MALSTLTAMITASSITRRRLATTRYANTPELPFGMFAVSAQQVWISYCNYAVYGVGF